MDLELELYRRWIAATRDIEPTSGIEELTPIRRVAWLVSETTSALMSGGLMTLLEGDWWFPEVTYKMIVDAYRAVGARKSADVLEEAISLYPNIDQMTGEARREWTWGRSGGAAFVPKRLSDLDRIIMPDIDSVIDCVLQYLSIEGPEHTGQQG